MTLNVQFKCKIRNPQMEKFCEPPFSLWFLSHDVLGKQSLHWSRVKEKCGSVNNKHVLMYVVSGLI